MEESEVQYDLTYLQKEPDVGTLRHAFSRTSSDLSSYIQMCRASYDDRRNWWVGKSQDLRKHGADAFPWEGASDMESHVIDERVSRLVALFLSSLQRANIKAFPISTDDIARSQVVSGFLKWMATSGYIPRFLKEMELGANYLLERGILITYVGWQREDRRYIQNLTIDQISGMSEEVGDLIKEGYMDDELELQIAESFDIDIKIAKRAVKQIKKTGLAEIPTVVREVDAPNVKTLAPDGDFFFPSYVTDPQRAPFCFWRTFYTAQELKNKVITDGWNEDFVDFVIERYAGVNVDEIERDELASPVSSSGLSDVSYNADELIEIIHGYQRLIDPIDSSEGIYETIFHREFDNSSMATPYAKFELLNGYEDYPVVVTKLSEDSKRLYDTNSLPSLLRGIQNQVKIEMDSRIDRNSLATLPPIIHPKGQRPHDYGPGRYIPYRRKGDVDFAPTPPAPSGSVEIQQSLEDIADKLTGIDDSTMSQVKRQFYVDKFLKHCADVLNLAFKCFQRFGPDEVFFNVTGVSDPQIMEKGSAEDNYDVIVSYDVLNSDPDTQQKKLQQFISLSQMDTGGRFNMNRFLEVAAYSIDPVLADKMILPEQENQVDIMSDITDDISKIYAGIEVPARQNGAQVALQVLQQYAQQPDIAQKLQEDPAFKERLEKYAKQYNFQIQQNQNAQIGRVGTQPSNLGAINTQGMEE